MYDFILQYCFYRFKFYLKISEIIRTQQIEI